MLDPTIATRTLEAKAGKDALFVSPPEGFGIAAVRETATDRDMAKALAMAQLAAAGHHGRALAWMKTHRLAEFDQQTPEALVRKESFNWLSTTLSP